MAVTAEYSATTWEAFFLPTFLIYPHLENQLKAEFILFKETGAPSDLLGRDVPFDFPPFAVEANIHHIHVNLYNEKSWHIRKENYARTTNHYLVYTEHMWETGRFLLMGLVTPAHEKMPAKDNRLLSYFSEIAEAFHAS
ncbi:type II toxin-antitoxin system YafO family toxin [Erwinia sp. CGal63]|uniref:type II toxin-antitoxin system YafO family toxin n=1 Tax=Erwinia sp. CGal63 TaxID=2919889 RepID=UPI0030095610